MSTGKSVIRKTIYLCDFNDHSYFARVIGDTYTIFDKSIVITQSNMSIPREKKDENFAAYLKNNIIQAALTKIAKNKKVTNIVYILDGSSATDIINSIQNFIKPGINKLIDFDYIILDNPEQG